MADPSVYDSPDLWNKVKAAKEELFNNGNFLQRYRYSAPRVASEATTAGNCPSSSESKPESPKEEEAPASASSPQPSSLPSTQTPPPTVNAALHPSQTMATNQSPSQRPENRTAHPHTPLSPRVPSNIPAERSQTGTKSRQSHHPPHISLGRGEASSRNRRGPRTRNTASGTPGPSNPRNLVLQHKPHTPSPLANEVSPATTHNTIELDDTPSKPPRNTNSSGNKPAPAKMSSTGEESDVVVLPNRGQRSRIPSKPSRPRTGPEPVAGPSEPRTPQNKNKVSAQEDRGVNESAAVSANGQSKKAPTPGTKRRTYLTQEEADELQRLRDEIVANAHRNRWDAYCTASPELLKKFRDGPGTDPKSKVYEDIANIRKVNQEVALSETGYIPGSSHVFATDEEDDVKPEVLSSRLEARVKLYKELYKKSPTAYPVLVSGKVNLSPMPTAEHEPILAVIRTPRPEPSTDSKKSKKPVKLLENSWSDQYIADWEYFPRTCHDELAYRYWFQGWLETTIGISGPVDIFHQAFFDGTGHADGEASIFMLDMRNYETLLDMDDEQNKLHAHETAAGYCYNLIMQNRKAEEDEAHRKKMARKAYLDYRMNPTPTSPCTPKANVYLRPVHLKDVPGLVEIYNWYASNSFRSPLVDALGDQDVRELVEKTRRDKFPFLVAVDLSSSTRGSETIAGYALAKRFDARHTSGDYTAELEVYVKQGHKNQGVGRCLLDKLLEACDATYRSKNGYRFEASMQDRSAYYPGGRRKLARLIFSIAFVVNDRNSDPKWVKEWLAKEGEFEEQGMLKGVRVKLNKFVNVMYLSRNVGCDPSNDFENVWK